MLRLNNLNFRKWWHPAIAVGIALVVAALAIKNHELAEIGLGIAACGIGEQALERYSRFNRPIGFSLIGLGIILIAVGLYRLVG
jgi:uncharacterized membrane protein